LRSGLGRLAAAALLACLVGCADNQLQGTVVEVIDGDTLRVLGDGGIVEVELADSYTVGLDEAYGAAARDALARLAARRNVEVSVIDRHGTSRLVGRVRADGRDVSAELVRSGFAWVSRKYASDQELYWLELDAKTQNRGLWGKMEEIPRED
jgi:endonuclease YncB( thermonuclease family)